MPHLIRRRTLLAAPLLAAAAANPIATIERIHGGRLGVFALDTATNRTLAHRADERFLMQSTFKGILATLALSRIDAGLDTPGHPIPYTRANLLPASPITTAHLAAAAHTEMSVADLCQAILERSDNTAANLLLAHVGGPQTLTAYIRTLGDTTTRTDRYEPIGGWSGTMDTTTPHAIATLARTMLLGPALTPPSRALLRRWMQAATPGRTRLRAAFPTTWSAADRTGTGTGICNDYAIAWPPNRAPLVIAAYYEALGMDLPHRESVLRAVGSAVVAWAG